MKALAILVAAGAVLIVSLLAIAYFILDMIGRALDAIAAEDGSEAGASGRGPATTPKDGAGSNVSSSHGGDNG